MKKGTNTKIEEILDLVNENDEVIGEVTKSEANNNPMLIHREVCVIIYDNEEKILFQQRSLNKKVLPGVWGLSCAGHVTRGVSPLETAHKELKEELGFDTDLKFSEMRRLTLSNESRFMYFYLGKYSGQKISPDRNETNAVMFMSQDEFIQTLKQGRQYAEIAQELAENFWKN